MTEPWTDLTLHWTGDGINGSSSVDADDDRQPTSTPPPGRVRHLSSVYVLGGLTYGLGSFRIESPLDGLNSIVVWRACRLDHALEGWRGGEEGGGPRQR